MTNHSCSSLGVLLIACVLAAGCEDSTNPLSEPAASKADKQLIGVWRHKDDEGTTYYHVGTLGGNAPDSVLRVVTVVLDKNGELEEPDQAIAFPTTIAGVNYLNVASAKPEQLAQIREKGWQAGLLDSYFILKYRVEDGALLAWHIDYDAKKEAIEAGKIKGEIKQADDGGVRRFTDTSQNLAKFVASAPKGLFSETPLRFERVR